MLRVRKYPSHLAYFLIPRKFRMFRKFDSARVQMLLDTDTFR